MTRILVVDDHPIVRRGLMSALAEVPEFHVVGEASDAREAAKKVSELKPDIMVTDILIPNGDNFDAMADMHKAFPTTRMLVLSVSDNEQDVHRAMQAGASGYLLKGVGLIELARSVQLVASGDAVFSPSIAAKLLSRFSDPSGDRDSSGPHLSIQEKRVLQLASEGARNKEIAERLYISETTVKAHFRNILERLHVRNRAGAVAVAASRGWLTQPARGV